MRLRLWMSAIAVALASGVAVAQMQVVALMPDQVAWSPAPGLPADWRIAVLMGDPAEAGPYVERVKLPPNAVRPTRILTTRTSRCFQVHLVSGRARSLTRPRPGASGGIVLLPARKYGPLRLGWPPRCDCADSWRRPERDQDDPLIRLYGKKAAKSGELRRSFSASGRRRTSQPRRERNDVESRDVKSPICFRRSLRTSKQRSLSVNARCKPVYERRG